MPRRRLLLTSLALAAGGCAPPASVAGSGDNELYVTLGRSRSLAVLDTTNDLLVARLPLAPLGWEDPASQIAVSPGGQAVLLPMHTGNPRVGIVSRTGKTMQTVARYTQVLVEPDNHGEDSDEPWDVPATPAPTPPSWLPQPERALRVTADQTGGAYVLVADPFGIDGGTIAVLDLARGAVVRQFPLGSAGDRVIAIAGHPNGRSLYASVMECQRVEGELMGWVPRGGSILAVDTRDGRVLARVPLPARTVATSLAFVAPSPLFSAPAAGAAASGTVPASAVQARLYAVMTSPPPYRISVDWGDTEFRSTLLALNGDTLELEAAWPLGDYVTDAAFRPDGRRAYLLRGYSSGLRRDLLSLELPGGAVAGRWPLPDTAYVMTATPVGKLYVTELDRDRLLAFDMRTGGPPVPVNVGDVPLALAPRPA